MPVLSLSANMIRTLTCPDSKGKISYYDAACKGLELEVRGSAGRTWYLRYTDYRGRKRQHRIGDANDISLAQARKLANNLRIKIAIGEDPREAKAVARAMPTFKEFALNQYMPYAKAHKRSWFCDEGLLRNHIFPRLGNKFLDEITKQDIISMHHARKAGGAAPGSANHLVNLVRHIFNLAIEWEVAGLVKNPADRIELFAENNQREIFLTQEETVRLYEAVQLSENSMLQYIVPLLILTGARKRELLDAHWKDFDIDRRQWRIPMSKSGKPRHVPLSDSVIQLLRSIPRLRSNPYVFPNRDTGLPYASIYYAWHTARMRAGLPHLRMHDLRHSFASFLVNAGRSLYEVQKILGHSNSKTTQRYAHLAQETLLDAANAVGQSVGNVFAPRIETVEVMALPVAA